MRFKTFSSVPIHSDSTGALSVAGNAMFSSRTKHIALRFFFVRELHQNSPFRGEDYMIPYTVGKLAPSSSHLTRGLVKYVPGKGYFRAVSSQNGDKFVTSPPPPNR